MKTNRIFVSVVVALFIISSCSKKDSSPNDPTPPEPDYSQCLLSEVKYGYESKLPGFYDPFTLTYDSLKRIQARSTGAFKDIYSYEPGKITQLEYINSVADSNLQARYIYLIGSNGRVVSSTRYGYFRPKSINDYLGFSKTDFEYNAEGYLTGKKSYVQGTTLFEEGKYTYQDGNQVQKINIYYDNPTTIREADTINYTYDTTAWFPEARYLYGITDPVLSDVVTGKPNKNNVISIAFKMRYNGLNDEYKSIQYTYSVSGKRLEKATMTASTVQGHNITTSIEYKYQCN